MPDYVHLALGIVISLLIYSDLFYTALSANGAFVLTRGISSVIHKIILKSTPLFQRKLLNISGMLINISILFMWLILSWAGLFFLLSYDPNGITNEVGEIASASERFYFAGYAISTLGLGNIVPKTFYTELITSTFSLLGFVMLTTAMTYFLSITSAVMHKRTLSMYIRNLGKNPEEILKLFTGLEASFWYPHMITLIPLIDRHNKNHQAYPVLNYFHSQDKDGALSINLAVLDEALSILLNSNKKKEYSLLEPLRNSITNFLLHIDEKYSHTSSHVEDIDWSKLSLEKDFILNKEIDKDVLVYRRRILDGLLKVDHRSWNEVYSQKNLN